MFWFAENAATQRCDIPPSGAVWAVQFGVEFAAGRVFNTGDEAMAFLKMVREAAQRARAKGT